MEWLDADKYLQHAGYVPGPRSAPIVPLETLLDAQILSTAQRYVERHAEAALNALTFQVSRGLVGSGDAKKTLAELDKEILATSLAMQKAIALTSAYRTCQVREYRNPQVRLVTKLLKRDLAFDRVQLLWLLRCALKSHGVAWTAPWEVILGQVSKHLERAPLDDDFRAVLRQIDDHLKSFSKTEKLRLQIDQLLAEPTEAAITVPIVPGEAWSDLALADLEVATNAERLAWNNLLAHAATANAAKPSGAWLKKAKQLLGLIGAEPFSWQVARWLAEVGKPGRQPVRPNPYVSLESISTLICESNADLLKGLVWACAAVGDSPLAKALGRCAEASYKKVPEIGPRCVKLGNACVQALAILGSDEAVSQIVRIKNRNKYPSIQKLINNSLTAAADKAGVSIEELEELAVPTYGLDQNGVLREQLGDFIAEIAVKGSDQVELRWLRQDGKQQASVPKAVKEQYAGDLKELKLTVTELQKMLPAYQARIESLYLQRRSWSIAKWKEHYLDHPLIGRLARRLIWSFTRAGSTTAGIWYQGELVTSFGVPLSELDDETTVTLWHPIDESPETVLAWRNWLTQHEVTQPFKQAHREVYLLTPAEQQTNTYSNRFAAHVLKQHQFAALCQQRGWSFHLMGQWDSANTPTKPLPAWDLRCEFWLGENDAGDDVSPAAIFLYVPTDQVRFYRGNAARPLALEEVPRLPFSETMRDVDLFIGVAGVGNDPAWQDNGNGTAGTYWHSYSFGDLSATAQTRRDVLAQIVPRLKIADRCRIEGNFLIVRGELRTYKIHLGSGNILMSPNDQYLCIVSGRTAKEVEGQIFLPFEGDHTLALILSKAFLLAADAKITDPSILAQIGRATPPTGA